MTLAKATSEIVGIEARLQWVRLMGSEGVETVVWVCQSWSKEEGH